MKTKPIEQPPEPVMCAASYIPNHWVLVVPESESRAAGKGRRRHPSTRAHIAAKFIIEVSAKGYKVTKSMRPEELKPGTSGPLDELHSELRGVWALATEMARQIITERRMREMENPTPGKYL